MRQLLATRLNSLNCSADQVSPGSGRSASHKSGAESQSASGIHPSVRISQTECIKDTHRNAQTSMCKHTYKHTKMIAYTKNPAHKPTNTHLYMHAHKHTQQHAHRKTQLQICMSTNKQTNKQKKAQMYAHKHIKIY